LIAFITEQRGGMNVRPDQVVVVIRDWPTPEQRLKGVERILTHLAEIAAGAA
ncbi:MAG: hypothetical protein RJB62_636, partial [Pseudomonadota bacterium]